MGRWRDTWGRAWVIWGHLGSWGVMIWGRSGELGGSWARSGGALWDRRVAEAGQAYGGEPFEKPEKQEKTEKPEKPIIK